MGTDKLEQSYTVEEVAQALKVGNKTVYNMLLDGRLKGSKPGGREWRVRAADVQAILKHYTAR